MTLNRYAYGRDNPERYTDPNGPKFLVLVACSSLENGSWGIWLSHA